MLLSFVASCHTEVSLTAFWRELSLAKSAYDCDALRAHQQSSQVMFQVPLADCDWLDSPPDF